MSALAYEIQQHFQDPQLVIELVQKIDKVVLSGGWNLDGILNPQALITSIRNGLTESTRSQQYDESYQKVVSNAGLLGQLFIAAYATGDVGEGGKDALKFIIETVQNGQKHTDQPPLMGTAFDFYTVASTIMPFKVYRKLVDRLYPGNKIFEEDQ